MIYCIYGEPVIFPVHCKTELSRQGYWGEFYVYQYLKQNADRMNITNIRFSKNEYGSVDLFFNYKDGKKIGKQVKVQVKTLTRYQKGNFFKITIGPTGAAFDAIQECDVLILVTREPRSTIINEDREWGGKLLFVKNHRKYELASDKNLYIPALEENFIKLQDLWPEHLAQVNSFKSWEENLKRYVH